MNEKILIVDDSTLNIEIARGVLSERDYIIFTASNGEDALETAASQKPDLILLDIMMPGTDGFSVLKKLKNNHELKDIPVIFLTGIEDIEYLIEGFKVGAVDYIKKPFNPYELHARVNAHLELKIAREELEKRNRELLQALEEIKTLKGLIPICANCKKIKDDEGYWHSVEEYLGVHSDIKFTHGLCTDCVRTLYPDIADEILNEEEFK